jgi:predicted metal-binding membrane protein
MNPAAMTRTLIASPTAQRSVVLAMLLAVAAACWGWLLARSGGGAGMDMAAMARPTMGLPATAFLVMWVVMMVAMMFPTTAPMVLTFHRIQSGKRARGEAFVSTWVFVAGYTTVWAAAGIAAYLGAIAAEAVGARLGLSAAAAARIGGAFLILAGIYQLTPYKNICLSKCRSPIGFLLSAWRDGAIGALRMGFEHGASCLGCCWLLMVILFPLGVMNLGAMAIVMLVVFAEKALPWERVAVWGTAGALILYGAVVITVPRALPTFTAAMAMPGMAMPMPATGEMKRKTPAWGQMIMPAKPAGPATPMPGVTMPASAPAPARH